MTNQPKKALITGIRWQDGSYLAKFLLDKGYEVYGADRRSGDAVSNWRHKELGIENKIKYVYMELLESSNIENTLRTIQPDEIYNLGAQSFVGVSFEQPILTSNVDGLGVCRILEAIRRIKPECKFYQASTSEMFGKVESIPQNEETKFHPRSPYGVAKLYGHWITRNYRESYGMFACSGILFNHESPLRGEEFVTRKITLGLAKISRGLQECIYLGNMDAQRDRGYAKEYVEGMWMILQHDTPDDYVMGTGKTHSIRQFIELACKEVGMEIAREGTGDNEIGKDVKTGKTIIAVSPEFYRPAEVDQLIADATKAKEKLGRAPQTDIQGLVKVMMEAELKRLG